MVRIHSGVLACTETWVWGYNIGDRAFVCNTRHQS